MKDYDREISRLEAQMKLLKAEVKSASKATQTFLNECGKDGITIVSIGKKTELVESTKDWPFGYSGSVFSDTRKDGWPAVWDVVKRCDISGGCGNTGQHATSGDNLIEGVYELKRGNWRKVD